MQHLDGFRNDLRSTGHSGQMMSWIRIVSFNRMRMRFSCDMPLFRQDLGKCIPVVCIKATCSQMFEFIVEPLECCSITTTEYPGTGSPCATIHGLNDPNFPF